MWCSSGEYDSSAKYNTAGPVGSLNGISTNNNTQSGPFFSPISQSHHQNPNFFNPPPPNYLLHAPSQSSIIHPPPSSSVGGGGSGGWHEDDDDDDGVGKGKGKKRKRASRRGATIVITTDTSNFRSMVREFTGFPSPPESLPRPFRPSPRHLHRYPPNPSLPPFPSSLLANNNDPPPTATPQNNNNNVVHHPLSSSHHHHHHPLQTPLPTTLIGSKFHAQPSQWPVSVTSSWPSHF